jgi:hypothetical protein
MYIYIVLVITSFALLYGCSSSAKTVSDSSLSDQSNTQSNTQTGTVQPSPQVEVASATAPTAIKYTYTDSVGYTYDISFTAEKPVVSIDKTSGKSGNVVVECTLAGTVSITDTTPGKKAPNLVNFWGFTCIQS